MPRSGLRKHGKAWRLALALALAATIAGLSVGWGLWQQSEYEWKAQHQSTEHASYARNYIRNRCIGSVIDKIDCATKARDEHRAYQRDEQDLVAQKTSALWTMIMGWAATFGMVLSAVGVYLVWTTFAETRRANEIAREALIVGNRAWLIVDSVDVSGLFYAFDGPDVVISGKIVFIIKNTGKSAATDIWTKEAVGAATGIWGTIEDCEASPLHPECIPPEGTTRVPAEVALRVSPEGKNIQLRPMRAGISISYAGGGEKPFITECLYAVSSWKENLTAWTIRDFSAYIGARGSLRAHALFQYFRTVT